MKSGLRKPQGHVYHTLVIGAGEAGSMIIQELKYSAHLNSKVVGVIDDNPHKKGKLIHGVRILGGRECILDVAKKYEVDEIILAIPSASPKVTRDILRICNQTTCKPENPSGYVPVDHRGCECFKTKRCFYRRFTWERSD